MVVVGGGVALLACRADAAVVYTDEGCRQMQRCRFESNTQA